MAEIKKIETEIGPIDLLFYYDEKPKKKKCEIINFKSNCYLLGKKAISSKYVSYHAIILANIMGFDLTNDIGIQSLYIRRKNIVNIWNKVHNKFNGDWDNMIVEFKNMEKDETIVKATDEEMNKDRRKNKRNLIIGLCSLATIVILIIIGSFLPPSTIEGTYISKVNGVTVAKITFYEDGDFDFKTTMFGGMINYGTWTQEGKEVTLYYSNGDVYTIKYETSVCFYIGESFYEKY